MKNVLFGAATLLFCLSASARDSTFYFTTSDNVRLYVRVAGKGKPCVFVHGGPGSTSYYLEAMLSAPLIEEELRMVYYDQRGAGRSDSASDYSIKRQLLDLEELRKALGFSGWAVMGHSFGGVLVSNYAEAFPSSVNSLMLIHCTLNMQASLQSHVDFGINELHLDPKDFSDPSVPLIEKVGQVHKHLSEKNIWYKLMYRNSYEKEFNDSLTFSIPKFNRDFASRVWGIEEYWKDFTHLSKKIKVPVLVMTGNRDFAIGVNHYKDFHFPKQTNVHYIGGHAPFQEEPQWFAEKIIGFTSKNVRQ